MEAIAKAKFLRGSPQKARLVIDLIRGKNVAHALAILRFTDKRATQNIEKCLRSAIANATHRAEQDNVAVDPDDLWVKACFVDQGPTKNRRRVRPAPQGRAYREQRYYCHLTVLVSSEKPENAKDDRPKKASAAKSSRGKGLTKGAKSQIAKAVEGVPETNTEEQKTVATPNVNVEQTELSDAPVSVETTANEVTSTPTVKPLAEEQSTKENQE